MYQPTYSFQIAASYGDFFPQPLQLWVPQSGFDTQEQMDVVAQSIAAAIYPKYVSGYPEQTLLGWSMTREDPVTVTVATGS